MATMDDLKKTLDDGLNIAKEGVAYVTERAEDLSRVAALRLRIFALRRNIERLYGELGETVYRKAAAKGNVWDDAAAKKTVKEIAGLEAKVNDLFAKLDTLTHQAARRARAAAGPATKATPSAPPRARRKRS